MKKSTWAIIGLSVCVWVLLLVLGVTHVHYKTTIHKLRIVQEFDVANTVRHIFKESGQDVWTLGMTRADGDFVVIAALKKHAPGSMSENIGQAFTPIIKDFYDRFKYDDSIQNLIISVRIPMRYPDGYKDWFPYVSFEFSKDLYESVIWENLDPKYLLRLTENVQWDQEGILRKELQEMGKYFKDRKKDRIRFPEILS